MMKNTIYASFSDPKLAHKAAGALLDRGLREEDLSLIAGQEPLEASKIHLIREAGLVIGGGALARAIADLSRSAKAESATSALMTYLREQGVESEIIAAYDYSITHGGAVLGATLPSGVVDEGYAWEVLSKYVNLHVTSYENRPYVA